MKISITGRKVNLKNNFKERVEKKLAKFDRMFGDDAEAQVTVTLEKNRQTVEVTINNNGMIYRAENTASEMNDALDQVVYLLGRQIRRNKTRLEKRLKTGSIEEYLVGEPELEDVEEELEYDIVRKKEIPVKPLTVDEAVLQMNMIGHKFYMFTNAETGDINVVYERNDGKYGLLEPKEG
ncbi:MAG: ribosome-associated translation inhibitor RaiA [Clostridiales bacterium]|nr:ribosome-associated translation inhibitor RaiA [Clostridiales bacterium]